MTGLQSKVETVCIDLAQGPCRRLRPWERIMEGFVIRQNVEHYRAMLKVTTDLEQRGVIEEVALRRRSQAQKVRRRSQEDPARLQQRRLDWSLLFELPGAGAASERRSIPGSLAKSAAIRREYLRQRRISCVSVPLPT